MCECGCQLSLLGDNLQSCCHFFLQIPAKALARASRTLASSSRSLTSATSPGGSGGHLPYGGNDALKMPAFAMRNLSATSKLPSLQQASMSLGGGSRGGTIAASSAGTASDSQQVIREGNKGGLLVHSSRGGCTREHGVCT